MSDFEEVVASARAHAGRPLVGIEWRYVIAAAVFAALMIVVGVTLLLQLMS
jgi:hypothetical protein